MKTIFARKGFKLFITSILLTVCGNAFSTQTFLKLDNIQGESRALFFIGQMVVSGWSWEVTKKKSQSCFKRLKILKTVDRATPELILAQMMDLKINLGELSVARSFQNTPSKIFEISFTDANIVRVTTTSNSETNSLVEEVVIEFAKAQVSYFPIDPASQTPAPGGPVSTTVSTSCSLDV